MWVLKIPNIYRQDCLTEQQNACIQKSFKHCPSLISLLNYHLEAYKYNQGLAILCTRLCNKDILVCQKGSTSVFVLFIKAIQNL